VPERLGSDKINRRQFPNSVARQEALRMNIVAAILYVLIVIVSWFLQLVGLPGNWLIVATAAAYAWLVTDGSRAALGWQAVALLVVLALVGELVEFLAGAMGAAKAGGSRRGTVLAIVGSLVGGIVGLFVGIPIPVIGSLVSAILFGGVGAMIGAILGESWKGRDFDTSLEVGKAAFVGRLLGTVGKQIVCTLLVIVALGAMLL
jgi:uncharacterized protein YqgC (DUF456 family)